MKAVRIRRLLSELYSQLRGSSDMRYDVLDFLHSKIISVFPYY